MKVFVKNKKGFTLIELERSKSVRRNAGFTLIEHEPSERVRRNEGFTLIELLVVIAIIGLLASIVLVSLSGARNRAKDARIIADMGQLRSTSEVFYGNYNTYTGLCANADVTTLQTDITSPAVGGTNFSCQMQTGVGVGNSYCIKVTMNSGQYWCVDSALRSKQYPSTFTGCAACAGVACRCE